MKCARAVMFGKNIIILIRCLDTSEGGRCARVLNGGQKMNIRYALYGQCVCMACFQWRVYFLCSGGGKSRPASFFERFCSEIPFNIVRIWIINSTTFCRKKIYLLRQYINQVYQINVLCVLHNSNNRKSLSFPKRLGVCRT